jgi:hypothetical protein
VVPRPQAFIGVCRDGGGFFRKSGLCVINSLSSTPTFLVEEYFGLG